VGAVAKSRYRESNFELILCARVFLKKLLGVQWNSPAFCGRPHVDYFGTATRLRKEFQLHSCRSSHTAQQTSSTGPPPPPLVLTSVSNFIHSVTGEQFLSCENVKALGNIFFSEWCPSRPSHSRCYESQESNVRDNVTTFSQLCYCDGMSLLVKC
jgi:hypothetical protein